MKQIVISSEREIDEYEATLRKTAQHACRRINGLSEKTDSIEFLEKLKFEQVGVDPLNESRALNIIEQVNQTFTYLASFRAAKLLFEWHPTIGSLTLNLGTAKGSDIETTEGIKIAAEIFAATSPNSNQKLKRDIAKVTAVPAEYKYVFFVCPGIEPGPYERVPTDGVAVWSLGIDHP
jgi:hypothetical protein